MEVAVACLFQVLLGIEKQICPAIVVGLFVVALAYLSYKRWLDVKWIPIENTAKSTLTDITTQAIHALNDT
jgi:hypothetical protein